MARLSFSVSGCFVRNDVHVCADVCAAVCQCLDTKKFMNQTHNGQFNHFALITICKNAYLTGTPFLPNAYHIYTHNQVTWPTRVYLSTNRL